MRYLTPTSVLSVMGLCFAVGCAPVDDTADPNGSTEEELIARSCPEAVSLDGDGAPRNAEGRIRYCWPSERNCECDQDDDCYPLPRYRACTPVSAAAQDGGREPSDPGDAVRDAGSPMNARDAGSPVTARDAGSSMNARDAGSPVTARDAGSSMNARDAGSPMSARDSGSPVYVRDAGTTARDAGTTARDAGTTARDAGTPSTPAPSTPAPSTPAPSTPAPAGSVTTLGGCQIFPADNPWNQDISSLPVHPNSSAIISNIQAHGDTTIKADFGSNPEYGIPFVVVPANQSMVPVRYTEYGDESDPGPFPTPLDAPIEGGNDHHVLVVQQGTCRLFELYHSSPSGSGWSAGSGAVFDLTSNALRPIGWTSCDQAGLPILPGLARYDEVDAGEITHALRVTFSHTRNGFIHPARHPGGDNDVNAPPMGLRLRLRANYDISRFTGHARVILNALRRYGMFVADTGGNWYISGATDRRWNDSDLRQLTNVPGTAFEAVDTGPVQTR